MLALQAEKRGITLIARASRGLGEIHADRRAVQQVLINLVGNALKFTEAGGVVTIDADQLGNRLRLVVADTRHRHSGRQAGSARPAFHAGAKCADPPL